MPRASDEEWCVTGARAGAEGGWAEVALSDGGRDVIAYGADAVSAPIETDGQPAVLRLDADGDTRAALVVGGTRVEVKR